MVKIGIIGSDNSHGLAFSKLVNLKNPNTGEFNYPGFRISAIYGHDPEQTKKVADEGEIEEIYENAEDMLGKVDAVMVIFREGKLHSKYALPFIEAGIPTWIDKPFTVDVKEAVHLVETAEKNNCLLAGGSTTKYSMDVQALKYSIENDLGLGCVKAGYLNFPGDINSEYSGIFFYGPHMIEMMLMIFGDKIRSLVTSVNGGELSVTAKYDSFSVILNFVTGVSRYIGIVYGEKKTIIKDIDISAIYRLGFDRFHQMLITKKNPEPLESLILPVKVLNAINQSIEINKEITIS